MRVTGVHALLLSEGKTTIRNSEVLQVDLADCDQFCGRDAHLSVTFQSNAPERKAQLIASTTVVLSACHAVYLPADLKSAQDAQLLVSCPLDFQPQRLHVLPKVEPATPARDLNFVLGMCTTQSVV